MSGKLRNSPTEWVDPDDAPELTAEFFDKGTPMIGDREVSFEEFARAARKAVPIDKIPVMVHIDVDILDAFRATGDGWQDRMNQAMREWMILNLR
ncbi:BrnA antitoxin family protein [Massilia sp. R2A-15]|uniref:BrnA antitoxin family protein n=1 Tax=Massilia sp. R2A-15 TaxID=3064278 RepID=UPI00273480B7|nr:BrnA antitoxin family protein [Massilia sp. R2A-15]WLI91208.1 BrnA antitoxin family protein [Massilia sp. R2A-15]